MNVSIEFLEFSFAAESYSLIIADLSLRYFDNETTIHIVNEIKRILKKNRILLLRAPSINDFNFCVGLGEQLSKSLYFEGDYLKELEEHKWHLEKKK